MNHSLFRQSPIIQSLLDTDLYKINMQQAMFHRARFAEECEFVFHARTDEDLTPYIPEIKTELEYACNLNFTQTELGYLANLGWFKKDYLQFLKNFKLDYTTIHVAAVNDDNGKPILNIKAKGSAVDGTLFEIITMAIISEVRNRHLHGQKSFQDVREKLFDKVKLIKSAKKEFGLEGYKIADFGTRRRFSFETQKSVIENLHSEIPEFFIGTSNIFFAREFGIKPIGTQAHEWYQLYQQGPNKLKDSISSALEEWVQEYRGQLGIALTDIITFDAFLKDFDLFYAKLYDGLRHDSGCPFEWGEKAIKHYESLGIDPKTKSLVFSDGLNIPKTIELWKHFNGHINTSFGVGTNLTCDLENVTPLNMVMKLLSVNDQPTAKISDSPGKTICKDLSYINYLKSTFGVK